MEYKEILVTGGSGFIGSHLVRRLVKLGFNVTVTAKYKSIIDCPRLVPVWDDINVVEADLRNIDSILNINKITKKYDLIYHLAAYNHVGDSFNHVHESLLSNLISTANLLEFGPAAMGSEGFSGFFMLTFVIHRIFFLVFSGTHG